MIGRGLCAEEQATKQICLAGGDCDEGRGPVDVLVDRSAEPWIIDHGTEPVLDLPRQDDEAGRVLLAGESDDHPNSLAARGLLGTMPELTGQPVTATSLPAAGEPVLSR